MMKLKGGDEKHSILNEAAKRMNLPQVGSRTNSSNVIGDDRMKPQCVDPTTSHSNDLALSQQPGMSSVHKQIRCASVPAAPRNKSSVFIQTKTKVKGGEEQRDENEESEEDEERTETIHAINGEDDKTFLSALRDKRLAELKRQQQKKDEFRKMGHGEYTTIKEEEFLPAVTQSKYCICHFFHKDFERCKIIDKHLSLLAKQSNHLPTKFIRLDAEKAPFFIEKLNLRVLPTVICFKDGIAMDRLVGFAELGERDDFTTQQLERRLSKACALVVTKSEEKKRKEVQEQRDFNAIRKSRIQEIFGDEDCDEDFN